MKTFFAGLAVLGLALTATGNDVPRLIFQDKFDSKIEKEWSWLREDPKGWRISKEGLEIRVTPEHGNARKNVLLGPARQSKGELSVEVFVDAKQTADDEHAGLQCYFDAKNWVGLIKEFHGKPRIQLTLKKDDRFSYLVNGDAGQAVWLRMVVSAGKAAGFYRATEKDEWKKMAECHLPSKGEFRFGLAVGGGPKDAEHWVRFRDFRIRESAK